MDLARRLAEELTNQSAKRSPTEKIPADAWRYTFGPSDITYDRLLECVDKYKFGVFLFTSDDNVEIDGVKQASTRDNVIFELGLWAGAHGKDHLYVLQPTNFQDLEIPNGSQGIRRGAV